MQSRNKKSLGALINATFEKKLHSFALAFWGGNKNFS
jgi:hypothetical protein